MDLSEANNNTSKMQRFATLWAKHQHAAACYIRVFVRDDAAAEDVLQEVAYSAASSFDRYDPGRPFVGWLIVIAKQRVIDHYRREQRRSMLLSDAAMDSLADAGAAAAQDMQNDQRLEALRVCLSKLNPRQKQAIDLRYGHAHTPAQVAEELGTNPTAVNALVYRIRKLLLDCIQHRMGGARDA